jgi:hypothetical protein
MLLCAEMLSAQPQVAFLLRDTTLQRGSITRFAIRAVVRNLPARVETMRLVLRYTPSLLLPESITGGAPQNIYLCPSPQVTRQVVNLALGSLTISCNQIRQNIAASDTVQLCEIEFRALASTDSVATLEVESLTVNNTDAVLSASGRRSRIIAEGEPRIGIRFTDAIEQAYPNPSAFNGVSFPYTIASPTTVQFSVFSLRGEEMYRFADVRQGQGRFTLRYVPAPNVPNGLYSLRMITERGVFRQSFMVLR